MGLCQWFRHEALFALLAAPNSFQSVDMSILTLCCIWRIAGLRVESETMMYVRYWLSASCQ